MNEPYISKTLSAFKSLKELILIPANIKKLLSSTSSTELDFITAFVCLLVHRQNFTLCQNFKDIIFEFFQKTMSVSV